MTIDQLREFRQRVYESMGTARDAQFELVDALLLNREGRSVVELSLNPAFRRAWSSVYAALSDGQMNRLRLERLYIRHLPTSERPVWAVDSTLWPRPDARTLPERGFHHSPSRIKGNKPIGIGHAYSTVVSVPEASGSWALPLAHDWIAGDQSALEVGVEQVKRLAVLSEVRPLVTMDSAYSGPVWLKATVDAPFDSLGRLRPNRVLYRQKPRYSGFGRPAVHGPALNLRRAESWFSPDEALCVCDDRLGRLEITVWHTVHFRQAPDHPVTVIHIHRLDARGTRRDPAHLWLMYTGQQSLCLATDWRCYLRRYAIEHFYRFIKQDLLWTAFAGTALRNTQLWSTLVTIAYWLLFLARDWVLDNARPWEKAPSTPATLSPGRVKRALPALWSQIGTPAAPSKTRGKSPGRPLGFQPSRRPHYPVLKKRAKPLPKAA
jgi:DDE superfamily endonuclease